jgi:iron complex outermembrane receptor protein
MADLGATVLDAGVRAGGEQLHAEEIGGSRDRAELAAFAAANRALWRGRVQVGGAGRVERVGAFDGWSANAGATLDAGRGVTLSASAGRTFRAPSHAELFLQQALLQPNPDLVPEESVGGDVAAALRGAAGLARVTAFTQLYRDLIVYETASFARLKPFNSAKAVVRGLELEGASRPFTPAALSLSAAYTLLRSENLRGSPVVVGRDLPLRPRHRLFARLASEWRRLEGHVELHHVAEQWLDTRNLNRVPSATTWNLGGSWRIVARPAVHLHVDARNLADARDLTDPFGNPLPGRMLLVGLRAGSTTGRIEP